MGAAMENLGDFLGREMGEVLTRVTAFDSAERILDTISRWDKVPHLLLIRFHLEIEGVLSAEVLGLSLIHIFSWTPADLAVDFTPASVDFKPMVQKTEAVYVPGELNVNVEQYPKWDIEYIGEPMYVPPSANPAYEE